MPRTHKPVYNVKERQVLSRIAKMIAASYNSIRYCCFACRDLMENLFTKEVLDEHRSRFKAATKERSRGRMWSQSFTPEYFLAKIEGLTKEESARLPSRMSSVLCS